MNCNCFITKILQFLTFVFCELSDLSIFSEQKSLYIQLVQCLGMEKRLTGLQAG